MALRTVLIVTHHFPPSAATGSHRLLGFVRHLPKFGWGSVVVAPPRIRWEPSDEALLDQLPSETALYHVPYPEGRLWKPVRKFAPYGAWLPRAWAGCRRAIRDHRPDAMLTSGPPHCIHLLGRYLRRRQGLPWIADFRDPWVAGDRSVFSRPPKRWEVRTETAVMRDADAIVANTPRACDLLRTAYPEHAAKMVAITNGYDPESFEANPIPPLAGEVVNIIHPGEIYANRDPGPFLEAIGKVGPGAIPGRRSLRVRFIGKLEPGSQRLGDLIRAGGLGGVISFCGQIPYAQSLREMVQADVLLLLMNSPGQRAGVPAKLYEYIGAGRPILALAESDSDVAWVLRESGTPYRIAPPRDPEAIRCALLDLLEDPKSAACGGAGKPARIRFTREHVAGELAGLLDSCLDGRSRRSSSVPLSEVAR
jgi:glycosyltransferase involved in cell wall biosynthesis